MPLLEDRGPSQVIRPLTFGGTWNSAWTARVGHPSESAPERRLLMSLRSALLFLDWQAGESSCQPRVVRTLFSFVVFLVAAVSAMASDVKVHYVRKDLEWGKQINLQDFGGPHIEVSVTAREMTFVTVKAADFTKMVSAVRYNTTNGYQNRTVVTVPTRDTQNIQKHNGKTYPGSNSTMYLLYHEPTSGTDVYFLDVISRQNHDTLVIATRTPVSKPAH